jgi:CRP-like cAMP-binding protein
MGCFVTPANANCPHLRSVPNSRGARFKARERTTMTIDRSLVADMPLFDGLAPDELDSILKSARSARYPKNTAVFEQGAEAVSFFVLLHGHLRAVKTTPDGQQIAVRYVAPGEVFGVAMAIGMDRYPATAMAVVDSVVLIWPSTVWPDLASRFPALAMNALQTVGGRLQDAHTRVIEMSTEQVEQRIAHALLRLAKQAGRKVDDGIEIEFQITPPPSEEAQAREASAVGHQNRGPRRVA